VEVGCDLNGARALLAAIEQPTFPSMFPPEKGAIKPGKEISPGSAEPAVPDPAQPKPKTKAKGKAKAKAIAKDVLTEEPDPEKVADWITAWTEAMSTAFGDCHRIAAQLDRFESQGELQGKILASANELQNMRREMMGIQMAGNPEDVWEAVAAVRMRSSWSISQFRKHTKTAMTLNLG